MTNEMYEDLLERNKLQISELNTLTEEQDRHIVELEKENAELKEQCSILADCNTCHSACKNENVEMKKQLVKAKEIIKEMLSILPKENIEGVYEITEEAEQFLNSEEEE